MTDFERDGFLLLDDFYSQDHLVSFTGAARQVIRAFLRRAGSQAPAGEEFDAGVEALEAVDHQYVADLYDVFHSLPEFLRIAGSSDTADAVARLLGLAHDAPLYTFKCRCRIDPPHDERRTYGWHQEVFYTLPESRFLQTWAPLVRDTTRANGTIEVCVGSHKSGIPKQAWIEKLGRATQIIVDPEVVARYEPRVVEMKLGQLLIFTGNTFHRSGNNTSRNCRYALVGMYHDPCHPKFDVPGATYSYKRNPKDWYDELSRYW